jgi:hypothetical protein
MKRVLIFAIIAVILLCILPCTVAADKAVTVCVKQSDGSTPISGVVIHYTLGSHNVFGTTDATGCAEKSFADSVTNLGIEANYNNGASTKTQDISINPTFDFQTSKITLRLETNAGAPLDGGQGRYGAGSAFGTAYFPGGLTGSSAAGETTGEFFPGTYSFDMGYQGTAQQKLNQIITGDTKITWKTTKVTLYYTGEIAYGGSGDSRFFNKPTMDLLPGTVKFNFRPNGYTDLTIAGSEMKKNIVMLRLKNHSGNPVAGGTARGGYGAAFGTWFVPGSTDANGIVLDIRDVATQPTTMSYEMKYNGVTQVKTQDVSANSIIDFKTILLTLRLETCSGTPLSAGTARYGIGNTFTTSWFPGGATSASGETAAEFFPGTYSFGMNYKGTEQAKVGVVIPNADTKLTWQTTKLVLQYSGAISYGGATGQSAWFTKPSMELMPAGPIKFHFQNPEGGITDLTWTGCEVTRSVFAVKLIDSKGNGISGATAQYYDGGWISIPGTTNANGIVTVAVPGLKSNLAFKINYAGASQEKWQNIATNSVVTFQTKSVSFKLLDSANVPITGAGTEYYANGWHTFGGGTTSATMELLPLNYDFRVSYAGASKEKWQDVSGDANVVFQTKSVSFTLVDSAGTPITGAGTEYYANGWHTFGGGTTSATMELLPLNYDFRVFYAGASKEKWQDVSADANVVFQTGQVTSGTCQQYYANGWKAFSSPMELLPVSLAFRDSNGPDIYTTPTAGASILVTCT